MGRAEEVDTEQGSPRNIGIVAIGIVKNKKFGSSAKIPSDAAGDEPVADIAQPEVTKPAPPEKALQPGTADSSSDVLTTTEKAVGILIGYLTWVTVISVVGWQFLGAPARQFLYHWWWAVGATIVLLPLIVLSVKPIRNWFAKAAEEKRTAIVVFGVLPLLLVAIGAIVLLQRDYQITVVRSVFLIAVCLFPALLYYLFIAARKSSLLNDYFVNLGRLGLLKEQLFSLAGRLPEGKLMRKVRLRNYVQKFEALYGPVPPRLREAIVDADDPLTVLTAPATSTWRGQRLWDSGTSGSLPFFSVETAIPVVLATVLIAIGWLMALPPRGFLLYPTGANPPGFWSQAFVLSEGPIVYAFLGAYFFSLQMLFRRYVRGDLGKSAYLAASLRIILAVIGTWVVVKAITATKKVNYDDASLLVIGFVIGVFPRVAWQFIQGATKALVVKLFPVALPSMESSLPLSQLDGLTVWHEARLEEEDIENIPNMANTEIVDLMLRTHFSPDRIVDWVDQAILFTYLGPDQKEDNEGKSRRGLLRSYGIRTATSLMSASEEAKGRKETNQVEKKLSEALRSDVNSFLAAIMTEPNLSLISAWQGIRADSTERSTAQDKRLRVEP